MENKHKARVTEFMKRAKHQLSLLLNTVAQGLVNDFRTVGRQKAAKDSSALTTATTHFRIFR